ncbi:hypothetical protein BJ170DRAFT_679828 [Xylariales sp. AK1849]|nr:hypothetical protein BJ170DRAFT_679828 [Xylariales sp. AK1849]
MSAPQVKSYHCDMCPTSFARSEHLQRHRRTHTREKPYQCEHCPTRFSRTDLLRRHGIAQHGLGQDNAAQGGLSSRSSRQQRLKIACDNCNLRKLKCDSDRPCRRCRARQTECVSSRMPTGPSAGTEPHTDTTHDVIVPAVNRRGAAREHDMYNNPVGLTPTRARDDTFRSQGLSILAQQGHQQDGPGMGTSPVERPGGTYGQPTPGQGVVAGSEASPYANRSVHFNLGQVPPSNVTRWQAQTHLPSPGQLDLGLEDPSQAEDWMNIPMLTGNPQEHYLDILQNMGSPYDIFSPCDIFENIYSDSGGPMWIDSVEESLFALQGSSTDSSRAPATDTTQPRQYHDARSRLQALAEVNLSRPPSPGHQQERNQWLASLGREDPSAAVMRNDRVIINEFLRLFQARVANWFSCFRQATIVITKKTRREWYLAMAALGGLYCPVEGSNRIARWLYHCARQQLFSYVYRDKGSSSSGSFDGVSIIETYILLQMFGYLSGDKRTYELTEALHCQTIQAADELNLLEPNGFEDEDKRVR